MQMTTISSAKLDKALLDSPIPALRRLSLQETDDEVIISGSVSSYYLKQLAQETILPFLGDRELVNQVKVVRGMN